MLCLLARRTLTPKFGLIIPKTQGLKSVKLNQPNKIDKTLISGNMNTSLGPPTAEPKIVVLSRAGLRENAGGLWLGLGFRVRAMVLWLGLGLKLRVAKIRVRARWFCSLWFLMMIPMGFSVSIVASPLFICIFLGFACSHLRLCCFPCCLT